MNHTAWFEERRDFFVTTVVKNFHKSTDDFKRIKSAYKEERLNYDEFNSWVGTADRKGTLWELKDMCHMLWGDLDPVEHAAIFMFDWIIGAIFHEAMKLKENCYMIHRYEPLIKNIMRSEKIPVKVMDNQCIQFFQDTMNDIESGISRLACMFKKAEESLAEFLLTEQDNYFLIRYLLEESEHQGYSEKGIIRQLLDSLFPDNLAQAYCMAGDSYLEGSWYTTARIAYENAINIDPSCREAREGLRILEKRLQELALLVERQYSS